MSAITRRGFVLAASALAAPLALGAGVPAQAQRTPDYRLRIGGTQLEIAPGHVVQTIAYNGTSARTADPRQGGSARTIDVTNTLCGMDEIVHWHGLQVPADRRRCDGRRRPDDRAAAATYAMRSSRGRPERVGITRMRRRRPICSAVSTAGSSASSTSSRRTIRAATTKKCSSRCAVGAELGDPAGSAQGSAGRQRPRGRLHVGFVQRARARPGDPIRVRTGERVLFRAAQRQRHDGSDARALRAPLYRVSRWTGIRCPRPQTVDALYLAPGERIDAIVEMNNPGVWVFGATQNGDAREWAWARSSSMPAQVATPAWQAPPRGPLGLHAVRAAAAARASRTARFELVFDKIPGGRGGYNRWTINGKSWPRNAIAWSYGPANATASRCATTAATCTRSTCTATRFEVTQWIGKASRGYSRTSCAAARRQTAEIEFVADNPGPSLFHCHMQDHQDFGFMGLLVYA